MSFTVNRGYKTIPRLLEVHKILLTTTGVEYTVVYH